MQSNATNQLIKTQEESAKCEGESGIVSDFSFKMKHDNHYFHKKGTLDQCGICHSGDAGCQNFENAIICVWGLNCLCFQYCLYCLYFLFSVLPSKFKAMPYIVKHFLKWS